LQQLQSQLTTLKDHSSIRRLRLLDAVESQMFYSEAIEAETWIREKRQQLSNPDVGKDEDSIIVSFRFDFFKSCNFQLNFILFC
jgi:spectrin beta